MTTQTPTSNEGGSAASPIDVGQLTQLASSFFAALPGGNPQSLALGGNPVPTHVLPGGAPSHPLAAGPSNPAAYVPGANLVQSSPAVTGLAVRAVPALAPKAAAGNEVPDHLHAAAPALDGRVGSWATAVPQGYESALLLPDTPSRPVQVPAPGQSGFYFVDDRAALATPQSGPAVQPFTRDADRWPAAPRAAASAPFDVHAIRRDFPILAERVNGKPLVWFDNAATTQKPRAVIDRLTHFYEHENSNIHRAAHTLAARATDAYEAARKTVARFIGASSEEEIVFVRGATEAINLVAQSWGRANIGEGDEIVVSHLEHHANIVPWQQLAQEKGATIKVIPVDDSGQVLLGELPKLIGSKTKLVAVTQVSNALGTVVPVQELIAAAHRVGARVLVDGAQSVSHLRVNVRALDADFFVFSGHKIFGPTGIGVVYGKRELLEASPPWQGGGNMIADVTFERTVYNGPPAKFEAGTGNIADAAGLGAALEYVERIGIERIARYEHDLLVYATQAIRGLPGLRLIGTADNKASVLSFVLANHDVAAVGRALSEEGIAVRAGHHCAQPILRRFGVEATVRPSLAFYNTCEEVDRFTAVIRRLAGR